MDLENFIEREFMSTAESLPNDFIDGQALDILQHFLGDRLDKLKKCSLELLQDWVYDNWDSYLNYERVASPFKRTKGYPIYTPFEIFIDTEYLPKGLDKNDYVISGGQACINTGYDCLSVDFSGVNFAAILRGKEL